MVRRTRANVAQTEPEATPAQPAAAYEPSLVEFLRGSWAKGKTIMNFDGNFWGPNRKRCSIMPPEQIEALAADGIIILAANRQSFKVVVPLQVTEQAAPAAQRVVGPAPVNDPLESMDDVELLAEYNRRSPTKRRAKFKTREMALAAIRSLAPVVDKTQKPKREPKAVRARMAELSIVPLVEGNPYKEGNASHVHFEKMLGGVTIRQYLARFEPEDQRVARQWLWNAIKAGHVKTVQT